MALRIAVPRMTFFIEQYSLGNLGGFLGSVYQDLHRTVFKNASFIVKEASGDIFLDDDSDAKSPKTNETTFKELFMRNEADMCGVLLEYRTVSKYLSPSCPVIDISGAALHTPLLRVTYQNVLNTLNVFSVGVISGIFLNVALLGIFLKLTKKIHLIDSTSSLSKCLINQANFNAGLLKAKALIMFWLICSFLIMEIYEQAINADMVTFDYSRIVESLIDLDRHKSYAPRFIQGDPILDHFKRSSDPVKKRVWNRKNKGVYQDHHQAFYGSFYKEVYIGLWGNVIGIGEVLCEMWRQKYKYLIATKGFGSATIGFQYRSNLPEKVKRQIWHTSLKIGETGIAQRLVEKHRRLITNRPTHSTPTCLCYSKEGLHEDEETLRPIGSEDMSSLIAIFRLFWALSVTVFVVFSVHCSRQRRMLYLYSSEWVY